MILVSLPRDLLVDVCILPNRRDVLSLVRNALTPIIRLAQPGRQLLVRFVLALSDIPSLGKSRGKDDLAEIFENL